MATRKNRAAKHLSRVDYIVNRNQLALQFKQMQILKNMQDRITCAERRRAEEMQRKCIKAAALRRRYFHRDKYKVEHQKKKAKYSLRLEAASKRRKDYLSTIIMRANKDTQRVERIMQADARAKLFFKRKLDVKLESAHQRRHRYIENTRSEKARRDICRVDRISERLKKIKSIQQWWRKENKFVNIAKKVSQSNFCAAFSAVFAPKSADSGKGDFDDLSHNLANHKTLCAARRIVQLLRLAKASRAANPRILLASKMINTFPGDVLGSDAGSSELTRRLIHASKTTEKFLGALSLWTKECRAGKNGLGTREHVRGSRIFRRARTVYIYFVGCFLSWKRADARRLAYGMIGSFVDISAQHCHYATQLKQNAEDPFLEQICAGYRSQMESLEKRVKNLIGQSGLQDWQAKAQEMLFALNKVSEEHRVKTSSASAAAANEQLMHNAMLDQEFTLKRDEHGSSSKETLYALSNQLLRKEFESLMAVLNSVRSRLAALTPSRADLRRDLEEYIDLDLIKSQLQNGVFGMPGARKLVSYIGEKLLTLQSPARREETKAWLESSIKTIAASSHDSWVTAIPPVLDAILRTLSQIELDVANVQLKVLSSQLAGQKGYEYEYSKFEDFIKDSGVGIDEMAGIPVKCAMMLRAVMQKHPFDEDGGIDDEYIRKLLQSYLFARVFDGKTGTVESLRLDESRILKMKEAFDSASQGASLNILLLQFFSVSDCPKTVLQAHSLDMNQGLHAGAPFDEDAHIRKILSDPKICDKCKAMLRSLAGGRGRDVLLKSIHRYCRAFAAKGVKQGSVSLHSSELRKKGLQLWSDVLSKNIRDFISIEAHHFNVYKVMYKRAARRIASLNKV